MAVRQIPEINRLEGKAFESTIFLAGIQQASLASKQAEYILGQMIKFDEELNPEQEVGIKLVSFGQTVTFHVSEIRCYDPCLITFRGFTDDGSRVELIQHVSQISFVLIALQKLEPEAPKRPIGFIQENVSSSS
jgi:hypothetical protein